MGLLKELWGFLKERKKFWLAPIVVVMVILSGLIGLCAGSGVLSPIIYALF